MTYMYVCVCGVVCVCMVEVCSWECAGVAGLCLAEHSVNTAPHLLYSFRPSPLPSTLFGSMCRSQEHMHVLYMYMYTLFF